MKITPSLWEFLYEKERDTLIIERERYISINNLVALSQMSRVSISLLLLAATITAGGIYFYSNGLEGVSSFDSNLAIDIDYYSKASYCKADTLSSWNCGKACSFHSGMTEV